MLAQTLAYGLFSARVMDTSPGFTRQEAQHLIPKTNPFLRDFFYQVSGPQMDDEPFAGFVADLVHCWRMRTWRASWRSSASARARKTPSCTSTRRSWPRMTRSCASRAGSTTRRRRSPRTSCARWTTCCGRASLPQGLADSSRSRSTILHLAGRQGRAQAAEEDQGPQSALAGPGGRHRDLPLRGRRPHPSRLHAQRERRHVVGLRARAPLPRLFGFELLMAPYAVAHFKLGLQLAGLDLPEGLRAAWAYDFAGASASAST